ncbi:MAG: DUF3168 domain-containing protein [Rhizobiales bacterium]|nr:DUF3168 domain-containing protein [Hyphomicrobiales bacterium]
MSIADIRPALRTFLLADSAVAAAVGGTRIYPVVLPQGQVLPSVVFARISGLGDHHMQGASGLTRPRMQIDAWARTADEASTLADLVKFRLDGDRSPMGAGAAQVQVQGVFFDSERDDYDSESKLFRVSRDYFIWWEER